jgi:hypothetical protein
VLDERVGQQRGPALRPFLQRRGGDQRLGEGRRVLDAPPPGDGGQVRERGPDPRVPRALVVRHVSDDVPEGDDARITPGPYALVSRAGERVLLRTARTPSPDVATR